MNLEGVSVLRTISYGLGILPTLRKQNGSRLLDYCRGALYIIIFSAFISTEYFGKFYVFRPVVHPTVVWTYTLCDFTVTCINILSVLLINVCYGSKVQSLVRKLQKLEVFIVDTDRIPKEKRKFFFKFFVANCFLVAFILFGAALIMTSVGWDMYRWLFVKEFQHYHIYITTYLAAQFSAMIGKRMHDLNKHLKMATDKNIKARLDVKTISDAYTTISELIESFNQIFGPLYIVFSANLVVNILVPLNMTLLYSRNIPIHATVTYGSEIILFCVFWLIFPFTCGLRLFITCGSVEKETSKVPQLCYTLIKKLSDDDLKLRDDLERYANQADRLKPKFSAAGFFDINNTICLSVLGVAATYIIVLLQFHTLEVN